MNKENEPNDFEEYLVEIQGRIDFRLRQEFPNEKWDLIGKTLEENFIKLLEKYNRFHKYGDR